MRLNASIMTPSESLTILLWWDINITGRQYYRLTVQRLARTTFFRLHLLMLPV